jgi:urease accessory protein
MAAETTGDEPTESGGDGRLERGRDGSDDGGGARSGAARTTPNGSLPTHPAFERYETESVPSVGVGRPGKSGELDLSFAVADGTTRLVRDYARVPFHVSGTLGHDPHPRGETVYVQSPTGGIAQGDRHDVSITAGEDAIAHVSTGSSTKVLSMEHNYGGVEVSLRVGPGAHLEYVPEPLILHADARYCQGVSVDLASDASAILGEVVVPGRLARGERFEFDRYASRLRAYREGRLTVADDAHLCPAENDPSAPGVLGEFDVYGTLYVLTPDPEAVDESETDAPEPAALSDTLHEAVTGRVADGGGTDGGGGGDGDDADGSDVEGGSSDVEGDNRDAGGGDPVAAGATALPNGAGVAVRALGDRADAVSGALRAAWSAARIELVGAEAAPRRKN